MARRFASVAGLAVLITMIASATAFASITPKIGVYGTPTGKVCLDGTFDAKKCNGKVDVFKRATGKQRQATIRGVKTGCAAIDKFLNSGLIPIKNGKASKTQTKKILLLGRVVELKYSLGAVWNSSKKATLKLKASVKGKSGCNAAAFKQKTVHVTWFSAAENPG
jgi:hypothetical protein